MRRLWLLVLGIAVVVAWNRASAFAVATFVGPPEFGRDPIEPLRDVREVIAVARAGATIKAGCSTRRTGVRYFLEHALPVRGERKLRTAAALTCG